MLNRPFSLLSLTRFFMYFLLGIIYFYTCKDGEVWRKTFTIIATLLFIGNHLLLFSFQMKIYQTWSMSLDLVLSACFGLFFLGQSNLYFIMFGIIAVTLFIMTNRKKILFFYIGTFVLLWGFILYLTFLRTHQFSFPEVIINFMYVFFCAVVGNLIRKLLEAKEIVADQYQLLSKSHQELSEVHEQLRNYSKQVEELTAIRERNQIAREIHDTVGHKITALLVQLQLAQEFINLDHEKCLETLKNCETLTRNSLEEIRTSVRTLMEDEEGETTFLNTIQNLLKDFSQMANMEVSLEINGDPTHIPTSLQPTITRITQEALTNSKRHGGATNCNVGFDCKQETIHLYINDNGTGVTNITPSFGLVNMRERVKEHGGMIQFESKPSNGFIVKVEFPLKKWRWSTGGSND
ncbi:MAG: sensor histidine kinase [Bacillota bacterium]|nr:sensor histidine kinase [Bacillota bacterium]